MQAARYYANRPMEAKRLSQIQSILRDPQDWTNFNTLLQFCAYYINYDSMCSGAVKNILIPFSQAKYTLVGSNKKNRQFFEQFLTSNNFEDILRGLAHDYWYYGQGYLYLYKDNRVQVLPPFNCEVEGLSIDGEPIVFYQVESSSMTMGSDVERLLNKYKGHPPEVEKALKGNDRRAQLEIGRTFRVSYAKAAWEKYALPILTSALPWLIQKDSMNSAQMNEMENLKRTFLEVTVGDKDFLPRPNEHEMMDAARSYEHAIDSQGAAPAVVSWNIKSDWRQVTSQETLKLINDSISNINWNILASLSMSPQLAAGDSAPNKNTGSSFSATQASVAIINKRINAFLHDTKKMMDKIFRIVGMQHGMKSVPELYFENVDLADNSEFTEELITLYDKGLISKETLFENTRFSYEEELEKRKSEFQSGADEIFTPPKQAYNMSAKSEDKGGRPRLDLDKRSSDDRGENEQPSPSDEKDYK